MPAQAVGAIPHKYGGEEKRARSMHAHGHGPADPEKVEYPRLFYGAYVPDRSTTTHEDEDAYEEPSSSRTVGAL